MSEPLPLSLIVITRDAARELAACLASAPFAAEAVVVDSGSRDDTVAVAQGAGARVIEHAFEGFGPQKNFAVAQARHDWVLCLDADERVSPELAGAIRELFAAGAPAAAAYAMARRNRFLGRWLAHGEGYPDWNVRLFDRRRARWSTDPVHEKVVADGPRRAARAATCCTRRPNRSTPTSRSRTATRRCRRRRCTRAERRRARCASRSRRRRASSASTW